MYADTYSFRTIFREDDNEFVGYCAEFPELSAFALDEAAAMRGIEGLVASAITEMDARGAEIPRPFARQAPAHRAAVNGPVTISRPEPVKESMEAGNFEILDV